MRNYSYILFIFFILISISCVPAYSSITMLSKDISAYPISKIKFLPLDKNNNILLNLQQEDFTFLDNGTSMPISNFTKCAVPSGLSSIAICFDLSIGQRVGNNDDFNYAQELIEYYLSYIDMENTEVSLLSFDRISIIESDFTSQTNTIANLVKEFSQSSSSNIYHGLCSSQTGGIDFLKNASGDIKSILLVTQNLISSEEAELIISQAKEKKIQINILYISDIIPDNIQYIADKTNGYVISNKELSNKLLPAIASLAKLSEGVIPYSLEGTMYDNCDGSHVHTLTCNHEQEIFSGSYEIQIKRENLQYIEANPEWLSFASIKPGTQFEKNITLTAKNSSVIINNLLLTHPDFSIKSISQDLPTILYPDETLNIEILFTPQDSSIVFSQLIIESNACYGDSINITGGFPNSPPKTPTVKIVNPSQNEVLVIGDTMDIAWTGLLPKDVIQLEYSFKGREQGWDTLARNVTDLHFKWPVPNIETDSFAIKAIQLWPNNVFNTYKLLHSDSVRSAFFNNSGEKVVTTSADSFFVWNASGGANPRPLHAEYLPDSACWATYVFDNNSMEDKYIGVASGNYVYLYNINNNYEIEWSYNLNSKVNSIEFSFDGKYAVVASNNGNASILDVTTGKCIAVCKLGSQTCRYAQFHPQKYEIITISSNDGIIRFFNLNGEKIDSIDAKINGDQVAYSWHVTYNHDGTKVAYTNNTRKNLIVFDRNTKKSLYTIVHPKINDGTQTEILFSNFSYDGEIEYLLTSGNQDHLMRRWYASTGDSTEKDYEFNMHTNLIKMGTFSFDGKRVLSASHDKTAIIWNVDQRILQSDTTELLRIGRAKVIIPQDTIQLGNAFINELTAKTIENIITNACDFKYNIKSIRIIGQNAEDFGIIDEFTMPYKFQAKRSLTLNLYFKPQNVGVRYATVEIIIPADTIYVTLKGIGIPSGFEVLSNLINFNEVFVDDYKDSTVSVAVNLSDKTINIKNIEILGINNDNFREFASNIILNPNDTLKIPIRFIPFEIGPKNAVLKIGHDFNDLNLKFNIFGIGIDVIYDTVHCYIQDLQAEIGQKVELPIYLETLTSNQNISIEKIYFTLNFNSSILVPLNESNEITIENDFIDSNGRRNLLLSIPYKPGNQIYNGLYFIAALGNDTMTNIKIKNVYCKGNTRTFFETTDAVLLLKNVCKANGERLFDEYGRFVLKQNQPNPAINTTTINFEILENGYITLNLYNINGELINNLFNGNLIKGQYKVNVNTIDLPAGTYFYTLKSKTQQQTRILTVGN